MDIYTETILDHYQHPHHAGALKDASVSTTEHNPICGDVIKLDLKIKNNTIEQVGFTGNGCAISQASMSLLTDYIEGKKVNALQKLTQRDVYNLLGITISPGRTKCALLGLNALQKILK